MPANVTSLDQQKSIDQRVCTYHCTILATLRVLGLADVPLNHPKVILAEAGCRNPCQWGKKKKCDTLVNRKLDGLGMAITCACSSDKLMRCPRRDTVLAVRILACAVLEHSQRMCIGPAVSSRFLCCDRHRGLPHCLTYHYMTCIRDWADLCLYNDDRRVMLLTPWSSR